jgi:hypothetical protein
VNLLEELNRQLNAMPSARLLLLFVFLIAYVIAISGFIDGRGRQRAAVVALLSAICLCAIFKPWTAGVVLVVGAVAGIGLFAAAALLLSRLLGMAGTRAAAPLPLPEAAPAAYTSTRSIPPSLARST